MRVLCALLATADALMQPQWDAANGVCTYRVQGQLFFVSVDDLLGAIRFEAAFPLVVLDLSDSHIWDDSAVAAIDKIVLRLRALGVRVELRGMNEASASLLGKLAAHDEGASQAPGH